MMFFWGDSGLFTVSTPPSCFPFLLLHQFRRLTMSPLHALLFFFSFPQSFIDFVQAPRTSLILTTEDRPGALADLLAYFAKLNLSLSHIESRPSRQVWNVSYVSSLLPLLVFSQSSPLPQLTCRVRSHHPPMCCPSASAYGGCWCSIRLRQVVDVCCSVVESGAFPLAPRPREACCNETLQYGDGDCSRSCVELSSNSAHKKPLTQCSIAPQNRCLTKVSSPHIHLQTLNQEPGNYDFFVDVPGDNTAVLAAVPGLKEICKSVVVLGTEKEIPWFPRRLADLDRFADRTLEVCRSVCVCV